MLDNVRAWDNPLALSQSCRTGGRPTRRYFCLIHCRANRARASSRCRSSPGKILLLFLGNPNTSSFLCIQSNTTWLIDPRETNASVERFCNSIIRAHYFGFFSWQTYYRPRFDSAGRSVPSVTACTSLPDSLRSHAFNSSGVIST